MHDNFNKSFIAPVRSRLERIKHKKAVDELKQRRAKGETALVIRNGVVSSNSIRLLLSPDIIVITEMLPKAPSAMISSTLFALPGYFLYRNFDPDNYSPLLTKYVEWISLFQAN